MGKLTEAIAASQKARKDKRDSDLKAVQIWAADAFGDDVKSVEYGLIGSSIQEYIIVTLSVGQLAINPTTYSLSLIVTATESGIDCLENICHFEHQDSGQMTLDFLVNFYG